MSGGWLAETIMRMGKLKYEFSVKGVNAAINDYIKMKWENLAFKGVDMNLLCGMTYVQVFIQSAFTGKGLYHFIGDVKPRIKDNLGGYTEQPMAISGYAHISIDNENEPCVDNLDEPITIEKR